MEEKTVQTVKSAKRSFVGLVTSDKMDKTIVVTISSKKMDRFTRSMLLDLRNTWLMTKIMTLM